MFHKSWSPEHPVQRESISDGSIAYLSVDDAVSRLCAAQGWHGVSEYERVFRDRLMTPGHVERTPFAWYMRWERDPGI